MFEKTLESEYNDNSECCSRTQCDEESERLLRIAKETLKYVSKFDCLKYGELYPKKTGESIVFYDEKESKVFKLKDPYAKSALKRGVMPDDIIYEHLVHNIYFPETRLSFEGITEDLGGIRIVLSQHFVSSVYRPTSKQIEKALAHKGLYRENRYSFGNEYISVTDVEGDNVLLGEEGNVLFIDPIINFKKSVHEILANSKLP